MPGAVRAIGLGDIRVDSALNEPLSAQIDIVGATRDDLIVLTAKIANNEVFQRYGADRPAFLASAKFKVGMDPQGRPVLNIRSAEPFTDPVVNFLVDLRWGSGELIREYSLLLDPPGLSPSRFAGVTPGGDRASPASEPAGAPVGSGSPRVALTPASPAQTEAPTANAEPATVEGTGAGRYKVAARDTLDGIVRHAGAHSEADVQRMMIATYRVNPHAFEGNINLLYRGAMLRLPSADDTAAIDVVDAKHEVRAQTAAWRSDGRPATAERRVAAQSGGLPSSATAAAGTSAPSGTSADAAAGADALKGRIHSLEHTLDGLNQQLASQTATLEDLKQRTASAEQTTTPAIAAAAPAAGAAAVVATVAAPAEAARAVNGATAAGVPGGAETPHSGNHPAPVLAAVAPSSSTRSSAVGFLGPGALAVAILLAGYAYRRRRLKALAKRPATPSIGDAGDAVTGEDRAGLPAAHELTPVPVRAVGQPRPRSAVQAARKPPQSTPRKNRADQTTQELAIDAEALEKSYLDALAVDTLGIDASDTGGTRTPAPGHAPGNGSIDLDTVAINVSDTHIASENPTMHTAVMDAGHLNPSDHDILSLEPNPPELDTTQEHLQAQHVQMPSQLRDQAVVAERRTNIVDALKAAIERDPHRRDLRMKLLETYYNVASANRQAFLEVVKKLSRERELLTADDWKQVAMMGREIAADDILFANPSTDDLADCA
jgi:FimV-like protein